MLDHNDQARSDFNDARSLYQQVSNKGGEADAVMELGIVEIILDRNERASSDLSDAQSLFHEIGYKRNEKNVQEMLASIKAPPGGAKASVKR